MLNIVHTDLFDSLNMKCCPHFKQMPKNRSQAVCRTILHCILETFTKLKKLGSYNPSTPPKKEIECIYYGNMRPMLNIVRSKPQAMNKIVK